MTDLEGSSGCRELEGFCHDLLARSCINYLWAEEVQQHLNKAAIQLSNNESSSIRAATPEDLPLLQYAITACFWHASNAEKNNYKQDMLLEQFGFRYKHTRNVFIRDKLEQGCFSLWCTAAKLYTYSDFFGAYPSDGSTLLHMASMANIETVVRILLENGAKIWEKDENGQQAVHYAAHGGATSVLEALMKTTHLSKFMINVEDKSSISSPSPPYRDHAIFNRGGS